MSFVELTAKGLELCQRLIPAVARYSVDVCEGMTLADQRRFVKLLKSLAAKASAWTTFDEHIDLQRF